MKPEPDYYAILQVDQGASAEQIRDNYRRLVKVFHPDRNGGDPWCHRQTLQINLAFEVLSDSRRRREYDGRRAGCGQTVSVKPAAVPTIRPARQTQKAGPRPFAIPVYEGAPSERSSWLTYASWAVMACSVVLLCAAMIRHSRASGHISFPLGGLRRMMMIPPLHTGLMDTLTGGGPRQIEHDYKGQFMALDDSAASEIDDAQDTLAELRDEDRGRAAGSGDMSVRDLEKRRALEGEISLQMDGLQGQLNLASHDFGRFDWKTRGVRRRLRVSSIDADLEQIDDNIEPLHSTVCQAQELIESHDPFADPAPPVGTGTPSSQLD